jgi:acyl-CoA synthetase (AMP-forming)/AMP-acid ligase II
MTMVSEEALATNLINRVNVGDMLARTAAKHPARLAIVDGDERYTYRQLDEWANEVANGLVSRGHARGDRVGVVSGNSVELLVAHYACAKVGLGFVPVNLGWRAHEVAYVLDHAKVRSVILVGDLVDYARSALALGTPVTEVFVTKTPAPVADGTFGSARVATLASLRGDPSSPRVYVEDRDPLQYLYTSGTTSAPKGAVGSHLATYLNALSQVIEWRFTFEDKLVCMMPMFHTGQLNVFCSPAVAAGASMVVMPRFDGDELLRIVETEKATILFGLPMMYIALLDRPDIRKRDLSSLRLAAYGMAPMPDPKLREAIEVFGCGFSLLFGQTEMGPVTTIFRPEHQLSHTGAVGTRTANTMVAIMDPDGKLLPTGETGEIVYRGPQVMNGYLDDPEATARAFRHGWFHSGDVGRFDDDGVLWFVVATRTSSRPAGRTWRPSRWRRPSTTPSRTLSRSPSSACRTRTGARQSPPSSCRDRASRSRPTRWCASCAGTSTGSRSPRRSSSSTRCPRPRRASCRRTCCATRT